MTLKVLMTADAVGGVWQYATDLAGTLADAGVETVLAVLGPLPSPDQRGAAARAGVTLVETGLPLDWLADGPAPVRAAAEAIAELAHKHGVDLIHYNTPALAAVRPRVPTVAVAHGCVSTWWRAARAEPLAESFKWHRQMTRDGLLAADRVVAPTTAYAELVAREYDLLEQPTAIHNGRRAPALAPTAMRGEALTVGRLWDDVKGAKLLDRVAARLPVPFRAVGAVTGPHGERVNLTYLHAAGSLSAADLASCYAASPVFVSAATFEPFGLAVLEAASAGCALVLSDIPGFRELWDGAARFVAPRDEDGYVQAITDLIRDRAQREELGAAATVRAARYTPEANAAAMLDLYRSLLPTEAIAA